MKSLFLAAALATTAAPAFACELIWTCPDAKAPAPVIQLDSAAAGETPSAVSPVLLACGIWPDGGCFPGGTRGV